MAFPSVPRWEGSANIGRVSRSYRGVAVRDSARDFDAIALIYYVPFRTASICGFVGLNAAVVAEALNWEIRWQPPSASRTPSDLLLLQFNELCGALHRVERLKGGGHSPRILQRQILIRLGQLVKGISSPHYFGPDSVGGGLRVDGTGCFLGLHAPSLK